MLDVHVLTVPQSRPEWVMGCLDSLYAAQDRAGFPVCVQLVQGVPGHIGQGRSKGYALGDFPYVACVDDDDYVEPWAFEQMGDALATREAFAISTPEKINRNGYLLDGKQRHHLIAYRRDRLIDHAPWICCGDVAQILSVPEHGWVDLPTPAYVHRVYESSARLMRRAHQDELHRALSYDESSRNADRLAE